MNVFASEVRGPVPKTSVQESAHYSVPIQSLPSISWSLTLKLSVKSYGFEILTLLMLVIAENLI